MKQGTSEKVRKRYDSWSRYYDAVDQLPVLSAGGREKRMTALKMLALKEDDFFLEVGCGTGEMIALALGAGARPELIVAADFSLGMLRKTRRKVPNAQPVMCDVGAMPFHDGTFDKMLASYALTSVPDVDACVAEMARLLAPSGRLVVLDTKTPDGRAARAIFAPTRAVAKVVGYTYMDRDTLGALQRKFKLLKLVRFMGGLVYVGLFQKS